MKRFEEPTIEIIEFDLEEVIAASGTVIGGGTSCSGEGYDNPGNECGEKAPTVMS